MEKLEHDPRTKQQIKDALYAFLYEPVTRQFKTRLDTLITRNAVMGGFTHKHFTYKGVLYNAENTMPPLKRNRLVPQLRVTMDEYLADLTRLNENELPFVLGFINQVLNASTDLADYLRVLPEAVHNPLKNLLATCPCRSTTLSEDKVESIRLKNQDTIALIKQRLVANLLI
jgi:hypothetical protein